MNYPIHYYHWYQFMNYSMLDNNIFPIVQKILFSVKNDY